MIARFPKIVATNLIAGALALAATASAQNLSQQLDPASIYGWIRIDSTGKAVDTLLVNVPAASLFAGRTPSLSADGSLMDQEIKLTALNAEGLSLELTDVKLIRSNDEGDILQLEVAVATTGAVVDGQDIQLRLENTTIGTSLTFGVEVNAAAVEQEGGP